MAIRESKEENFVKKVFETIKKNNLIENGDRVVLGVSGGPDSICMLNVLDNIRKSQKFNLNFEIFVAHVNHQIREEAQDDEKYVKDFCNKKDIDFYSKSIDVQKLANNNKIGTEEAGRMARYNFFDEILNETKSNKIAIAHNKNDRVETVIMNALRGCGISGLKGIEIKRDKYIRPLIKCEREEIENYCEISKLKPRIDKTNFETIYTRNKIRNVVIPYVMKEFNPNIIETIDRLSDIVEQQEEYMQKMVQQKYTEILIDEDINKSSEKQNIILDLEKFNNQENVIKSRLLLYTITRLLGDAKGIGKIHIQDIIKLCGNNIGNKYLTPNKNIKILVKDKKIYFESQI